MSRGTADTGALLRHPAFSDLDRHFAMFMARLAHPAPLELTLAAALASRSRGEGHICLDLRAAAHALPEHAVGEEPIELPEFASWIKALKKCRVVGRPQEFKPLILDEHGRLYLHRYWQYEANLAGAIRQRASSEAGLIEDVWLRESLRRYFPPGTPGETDWQQVAAFTALTKRLCIISGGPGTGKTRTVVVLLAMLVELASGQTPRIALAAPTGKAAARLQESIKKAKAALPCSDEVKAQLPEEAATVHRLLGALRDSAGFKHTAANPLPFDTVVLDEASMVDLALMAKLFDALPPSARIILLGDKDQLASVEAGAVLGDLCQRSPVNVYSENVRAKFRRTTGEDLPQAGAGALTLGDCIVELQRNYRFGSDNGILALSRAVNGGDAGRALALLRESSGKTAGIAGVKLPDAARLKEALRAKVLTSFGAVLQATDAKAALQALGQFRILCALRQGPFGVENVNQLVEEILHEAGFIPRGERWYAGRPVMVLKNDYGLRLFNGDVGIVWLDPESGQPRAFFLDADNELRSVAPVRLPEHETVFAMTVHKSQGSEFGEVLFVLPDRENPVLTRELVYTGITRASRRVEVWFDEPVLRAAVSRRVERTSGLKQALWGDQSRQLCLAL